MVETRARHHKASRVRGQKMCCSDYTCAHISPQWLHDAHLSHLVLNTCSNGQLKFVEVRGTKRMRSRQCSIRERICVGEIKSSLSKQHKNKNPHGILIKTMCIYICSSFYIRPTAYCSLYSPVPHVHLWSEEKARGCHPPGNTRGHCTSNPFICFLKGWYTVTGI